MSSSIALRKPVTTELMAVAFGLFLKRPLVSSYITNITTTLHIVYVEEHFLYYINFNNLPYV